MKSQMKIIPQNRLIATMDMNKKNINIKRWLTINKIMGTMLNMTHMIKVVIRWLSITINKSSPWILKSLTKNKVKAIAISISSNQLKVLKISHHQAQIFIKTIRLRALKASKIQTIIFLHHLNIHKNLRIRWIIHNLIQFMWSNWFITLSYFRNKTMN